MSAHNTSPSQSPLEEVYPSWTGTGTKILSTVLPVPVRSLQPV